MIQNICYILVVSFLLICGVSSAVSAQEFWEGQVLGMQNKPVPSYNELAKIPPKVIPKASKLKNVKVRITNKTTASSEEVILQPDTLTQYHGLEFLVKSCWVGDEEYKPEHAVLISIYDIVESEKKQLFSGWLFANKHTITTLEHPYFDVTMLECLSKSTQDSNNNDIKMGVK